MLATTTQFQVMVEGEDQAIAYGVTIDLPSDDLYPGGGVFPGANVFPGAPTPSVQDVSIAVTRLSLDASITTDMPPGTRIEEGFSTTGATFTLSGQVDADDETKTAGWLFGRYAVQASDGSYSPLRRKDVLYAKVTITLGLFPEGSGNEPELLTKLVGLVQDYSRNGDEVSFTVIDLRQQFRGSVDLPAVVTVPPFNAGLTNEFVVDRILRQATGGEISSWPAVRDECVLAVGFRSSLWAEVGTLDTTQDQPGVIYLPGVMGTGLGSANASLPGGWANVTYALSAGVGTSVFVEWWQTVSSDVLVTIGDTADGERMVIGRDHEGLLRFTVIDDGGGFLVVDSWSVSPSADGYTAFTVTLPAAGGTAYTVTYNAGASSHTVSSSFAAARTHASWGLAQVSIEQGSIEALQVTTETAPVLNDGFTPRAVLDASLNPLDVVAGTSGDQWQTIQTLGASELAVAGFEGDTFRYRNRRTLRSSPSVRTITSDQALTALEESSSAAAVVNKAQVGWTPWTFADTATTLWTAAKAHKVPAKGTWSTTVKLDTLATQIDSPATVMSDGETDTTHSFFRASIDKAGTAKATGVTVAIDQVGGDSFKVTATNGKRRAAWLVSSAEYIADSPLITAGTPLVRVAGIAVTAGDEQVVEYEWPLPGDGGAASSRFGEIVYQLSGNPWIQDEDAARTLAQDIVAASYVARPDLVNVAITPDPRLERCDRVRIVDTARTGVDEYAVIYGWHMTYQAGSPATYEMTIDARTVAPPEGWIGGVAGRSEGGVTTWGY